MPLTWWPIQAALVALAEPKSTRPECLGSGPQPTNLTEATGQDQAAGRARPARAPQGEQSRARGGPAEGARAGGRGEWTTAPRRGARQWTRGSGPEVDKLPF